MLSQDVAAMVLYTYARNLLVSLHYTYMYFYKCFLQSWMMIKTLMHTTVTLELCLSFVPACEKSRLSVNGGQTFVARV